MGESGDDSQQVAKDGYPRYDREQFYYPNRSSTIHAGFFYFNL
jgi:hypothetical protein